MLVVVAIIGVLAAVAIPAYNTYQANAAQNTAKLSAKSIYKAVAVCFASGAALADCITDTTVNGSLDRSCTAGLAAAAALTAEGCQIGGTAAGTYCTAARVKDATYCTDTAGNDGDSAKTKCGANGACQ